MHLNTAAHSEQRVLILKKTPNHHINIPCKNCMTKNNCLHQILDNQLINELPNKYVTKIKIKKGDPIIRNGDGLNFLYNLRIGYCKLEFSLSNGQYQINHFAYPGDLLGIDGIADGRHRLDVSALSDGELCAIEYKTLTDLIMSEPKIRYVYEKMLSRSINLIEEHLFSLGSHSAEQKLAFFLLNFHNRQKELNIDLRMMRLPMSREDLKSYLGMTSETLSRSFAFLERNNFLEVKNRNISNINYERLAQFVEQKEKIAYVRNEQNSHRQNPLFASSIPN
jgi:CRP/FNR family transcriptional regulator